MKKEFEAKTEAVTQKNLQSESFFFTQKQEKTKKFEIKAEIQKLKDEQAYKNTKRLQKIE